MFLIFEKLSILSYNYYEGIYEREHSHRCFDIYVNIFFTPIKWITSNADIEQGPLVVTLRFM